MTEEQQGFCGCLILILIVVLVGVAIRADNVAQALNIGALTLGGLVLMLWGIALLASEKGGCVTGFGTIVGLVGLAMAIVVGYFLVTGDYNKTMEWAQKTYFEQKDKKAEKSDVTPTAVVEVAKAVPTEAALAESSETPISPTEVTSSPTGEVAGEATKEANVALTEEIPGGPASTDYPGSTESVTGALELPTQEDTGAWKWLLDFDLTPERVTEALNTLRDMPDQEVGPTVEQLRAATLLTSGEHYRAALLLLADALEQGENPDTALTTYQVIGPEPTDDPFVVSAAFRVGQLENPQKLEKYYEEKSSQPERWGWFLVADQWEWNTTRHATWQGTMTERQSDLSIRFFNALRDESPFESSYHYMFILLVMTLGIKILALPLYTRSAKASVQLRRLTPQIQAIRSLYSGDSVALNQRLMELYRSNGVNIWSGCAASVVDLIFVVWALIAMGSYQPQMLLDGSKFMWVSDVTQADARILVVWGVISLILAMITGMMQQTTQQLGQSPALMSCSTIVFCVIIGVIAMQLDWPAYVFIFWTLLSLVGLIITGALMSIWLVAES
jgi:YidC/Oxa1 family membrane protein insertase